MAWAAGNKRDAPTDSAEAPPPQRQRTHNATDSATDSGAAPAPGLAPVFSG